jgi:hypothetical protein
MVYEDRGRRGCGLWSLGTSLLALGQQEDALSFISHIFAMTGWRCDSCRDRLIGIRNLAICQYCFDLFCEKCLGHLELPQYTRFCVPGHCLVVVDSCMFPVNEERIIFPKADMDLGACLQLLKV